jgi:hypothetical protein
LGAIGESGCEAAIGEQPFDGVGEPERILDRDE